MLPTAMAGSCAVPKPHPHPKVISKVDASAWLCLGAAVKLQNAWGLEKCQASESLVLVLFHGFPERHVFSKDKDLAGF